MVNRLLTLKIFDFGVRHLVAGGAEPVAVPASGFGGQASHGVDDRPRPALVIAHEKTTDGNPCRSSRLHDRAEGSSVGRVTPLDSGKQRLLSDIHVYRSPVKVRRRFCPQDSTAASSAISVTTARRIPAFALRRQCQTVMGGGGRIGLPRLVFSRPFGVDMVWPSDTYREKARMLSNSLQLLFTGLVLISSGCATSAHTAATLPAQMQAPPPLSAQQIDLSQIATAPVRSDSLHPGDAVRVTLATGVEVRGALEWDVRVSDSGELNLPIIGSVGVGGLTTTEAAQRITQEAIGRGKYISPKITVAIEKPRSYQVRVVGAVNEPDTYELPASRSDLLTALTRAKGLAEDAAMTVEIRHPELPPATLEGGVAQAGFADSPSRPQRVHVNLNELAQMSAEQLRLYDGSVVMVSRRSPRRVNVLGLVREPAAVEMPEGEDLYLLDVIARAKGTTNAFANNVRIARRVEGNPRPVVIEASLRDARQGGPSNLRLAAGDVVTVEQTPLTMAVDTVTTFFRVGFSAALPGL